MTAGQTRSHRTSDTRDSYPDLYLPVVENYRISDKFYGHSDSLSTDNNPMVLVELQGLSYQYGTSIYAVDRVNETMYSTFEVGYKMISEKATVRPQFRPTSLEGEYTIIQTFLCKHTAWNNQYRYSNCKIYSGDPGITNAKQASCFISCMRYLRAFFK